MARVRTSVSLGTVAVVVLGGLSLGLGSVAMPGTTTLGGPVVLSARPDIPRPLTSALDAATDAGTPQVDATSTEPVGVRAPEPVRAETSRAASQPGTNDSAAKTRTSGSDVTPPGASVPTSDAPAPGSLATSGTVTGQPTRAPTKPSRSSELPDTVTTSGGLTTEVASEDTQTHDRP